MNTNVNPQAPLTPAELLQRHLQEWQTLKTQISEAHDKQPTHALYLDLMTVEAMITNTENNIALL